MSETTESDMDILQERDAIAMGRRLSAVRAAVLPTMAVVLGEDDDCADCGDGIPVERLRAAPFAVRCVTCQALSERRSSARC